MYNNHVYCRIRIELGKTIFRFRVYLWLELSLLGYDVQYYYISSALVNLLVIQ